MNSDSVRKSTILPTICADSAPRPSTVFVVKKYPDIMRPDYLLQLFPSQKKVKDAMLAWYSTPSNDTMIGFIHMLDHDGLPDRLEKVVANGGHKFLDLALLTRHPLFLAPMANLWSNDSIYFYNLPTYDWLLKQGWRVDEATSPP